MAEQVAEAKSNWLHNFSSRCLHIAHWVVSMLFDPCQARIALNGEKLILSVPGECICLLRHEPAIRVLHEVMVYAPDAENPTTQDTVSDAGSFFFSHY